MLAGCQGVRSETAAPKISVLPNVPGQSACVGSPEVRGQGQQQPGDLELDPGARRPPSPWSVPGWQGGGEEVDEQLVDALRLVVMHPVRRVGQALDAVEVGYVVVVGLG